MRRRNGATTIITVTIIMATGAIPTLMLITAIGTPDIGTVESGIRATGPGLQGR